MSGCRELNPVYTSCGATTVPRTVGNVILSGCRELNPVYTHPKRAYYRHTPSRQNNISPKRAYLPRSEPQVLLLGLSRTPSRSYQSTLCLSFFQSHPIFRIFYEVLHESRKPCLLQFLLPPPFSRQPFSRGANRK